MSSKKIVSRKDDKVSPWVTVVSKEVRFETGQKIEVYHCLAQKDYVAILAETPGGLIPVVRQFRPAVEDETLELPSGLIEEGETPEETCRKELMEEAGLMAKEMKYLGNFYPDTGRLENLVHVFWVKTSNPDPRFKPEPGMSVEYITRDKLWKYVKAGKFKHMIHVGVLTLALTDSKTGFALKKG